MIRKKIYVKVNKCKHGLNQWLDLMFEDYRKKRKISLYKSKDVRCSTEGISILPEQSGISEELNNDIEMIEDKLDGDNVTLPCSKKVKCLSYWK